MSPQRSFLVLFVLVIVFLSQPLSTRAQTPATVTSINTYTADVDRFVKTNKRHRIFADVATEDDKNEIWKEFKSNKDVEDSSGYSSALVWTRKGKVVTAQFGFSSGSGDWIHYVNYYFRDDGSLAKIEARLNTFHGDVSVLRNRYYASNGKLLKSTKTFLDLTTQRSKKPGDFFDNPVPVYLNVSGLPFSKLL